MVGDEERRIELLVQLERDVFGLATRQRRARPRALAALRDLEEPHDELLDREDRSRLVRTERKERAADVIGVPRPDERQDLVVGDDRDGAVAHA